MEDESVTSTQEIVCAFSPLANNSCGPSTRLDTNTDQEHYTEKAPQCGAIALR
jgi:hypothetical protein